MSGDRIMGQCKGGWLLVVSVLTLFLSSRPALADSYHDPDRHFTFEIPKGWQEMEPPEVQQLRQAIPPAEAKPPVMITTAFRPKDRPFGTGPMTMITGFETEQEKAEG